MDITQPHVPVHKKDLISKTNISIYYTIYINKRIPYNLINKYNTLRVLITVTLFYKIFYLSIFNFPGLIN